MHSAWYLGYMQKLEHLNCIWFLDFEFLPAFMWENSPEQIDQN